MATPITLEQFADDRLRRRWFESLARPARALICAAAAESVLRVWDRDRLVNTVLAADIREQPRVAIAGAVAHGLAGSVDVESAKVTRDAMLAWRRARSLERPLEVFRRADAGQAAELAMIAAAVVSSASASDEARFAAEAVELVSAAGSEDRASRNVRHLHTCALLIAEASERPHFIDAMRLLRGPVMLRVRRFHAVPDRLAVALDRLAETGSDASAREMLRDW
jgi:hypothetical protein